MFEPSGGNEDTFILIPARGGSKSIKNKNIAPFMGLPLLQHVVEASKRVVPSIPIICSTDSEEIAKVAERAGAEVMIRPDFLSDDKSPVLDTVRYTFEKIGDAMQICCLAQPTSPFLLPEHIETCVNALRSVRNATSSQTIIPVSHNSHAFNQRIIRNDFVMFRFKEERRNMFNKQLKPKHFLFGNVVCTKRQTLNEENDIFGSSSIPIEIPEDYGFDLDTERDIKIGEFLLANGYVSLPWLDNETIELN